MVHPKLTLLDPCRCQLRELYTICEGIWLSAAHCMCTDYKLTFAIYQKNAREITNRYSVSRNLNLFFYITIMTRDKYTSRLHNGHQTGVKPGDPG